MSRSTGWQAGNFAAIGAIGFLVDGGLLSLLHSLYGAGLVPARLLSFSAAVTVTWLLNRRRTFAERRDSRPVREWSRYATVNSVGALINMGVFFWLIGRYEFMAGVPLLPLAIAAILALAFNFFASKHIAFRQQHT